MPLSSLADILKSHEKRLPFAGNLRANRVCSAARSWIAATWGSDVLELVRQCSFRDGVISLGVASAPFAEELRLREQQLRDHVRSSLPRHIVRSVRVFVSS